MSIVKITKDEIKLFSGMNESAFGKTNYASIITQAGVFFDGKEFNRWTFDDIRGEEIEASSERQVIYCGKNPFDKNKDSLTLLEFFEKAGSQNANLEDKKEMYKAAYALTALFTKAARENFELPKIGAGGIIIQLQEDSDEAKILFLPQNLFESSCAGLDSLEYSNLQGCWINTTIFDLPSLCFQRAVVVYKMLTGKFPFPATNLTERNADILDQKFLPIELRIKGINPQLAKEINRALKLNANIVDIPGKKKKGKSSEDLSPNADFPLELLKNLPEEIKNSKADVKELEEKAEKFLKNQKFKVDAKRAIRRNLTRIGIIAIVGIILAITIVNFVKTNQEAYSSRGLTSVETLEALFQGVNDKDTVLLDNLTKGKMPKNLVNTVSRMYVLGKQRRAYSDDNGFASPQNWILFLKDETFLSKTGLYGVTNVKIDGQLQDLQLELHTKAEKIPPVTEEKGVKLENGMKSVHLVEYFLLHSEGEQNELFIEMVEETYTLTYKKDRWIVTDISSKAENLPVDSANFYYEYFSLLRMNKGDAIRSVQLLSGKYPWLPQKNLLEEEKAYLDKLVQDPFLLNN
ncbi:MAG: hypothetical protein K5866_03765 [Treponema sp.]|nr:hypothetical protein [Treponema sp.]